MYGPPGVAYVYLVYGMYDCLNVVTEPEGRPAAVLIRAVEPVEGVAAMREARLRHASERTRSLRAPEARDRAAARLAALPTTMLASGPGLVAAAFDISRADTGADLLDASSSLRLSAGEAPASVAATARVGIGYAAEPWRSVPWRFVDPTSPAISRRTAAR